MPPAVERLVDQARDAERDGRFADARTHYEEALRLLHGPKNAPLAASITRWVGSAYRDDGDYEAAIDCYEASRRIAQANEDLPNLASAYNAMAAVRQNQGQLDAAEELYITARRIAERTGDVSLMAMVDQNMGAVANTRGDLARALEHYHRSLESYRKLGNERFIGQVLNNLGMVYTDMKRWDEAERVLDEAAATADGLDDQQTRILIETNLAELFILRGDLDQARRSCRKGFALANRLQHQLGLAEFLKHSGIIYRMTGDHRSAEAELKSALEIALRFSDRLLEGEVQRELGQLYRAQDRNRETLQALNAAHRAFDGLRARLDLADVAARIQDLESLFFDVVRRWGESIESKDRYTAGHCERVAQYSCKLAERVGFDDQTLTWFRMGAYLHDVGKTAVPAEILNKDGPLTDEEWEIMRNHTIAGEELLRHIEFPWDVKPMIRNHHEHWNGGGYPDGLKGEEIPLSARVLCVADCFDALTTDRPYRKAFSHDKALEIMRNDAGKIFDPKLLAHFEKYVKKHLTNGKPNHQ